MYLPTTAIRHFVSGVHDPSTISRQSVDVERARLEAAAA